MNSNVPNVIVRPSLIKKQNLEVFAENDLVGITIGNTTLKMGYEDALKISQWIRLRAKEAKANAGDMSRHWSVIGNLGSLDHNGEQIKPNKKVKR